MEINTELTINNVEQSVRIEFDRIPEILPSADEPHTPEEIVIHSISALDADDSNNELVFEFPQWLFEILYDDAVEAVKAEKE